MATLVIFPACTAEDNFPCPCCDYLLLRVATGDILTQPWNPVAGTNWEYDRFVQMASQDMGVVPDPNNGLYVPWRVERAEVTVQAGLPVGVTAPNDEWLSLDFSDGPIEVPASAWVDWDAEAQEWTTAGEEFPGGETALTRTVVYYPEDIWDVEFHDGSRLSPADFILAAIMQFDRAKPESDIYDESYVNTFDAFMEHFKGVTFDFDEPGFGLVVTIYDDSWYLDAEWIVALGGSVYALHPVTPLGDQYDGPGYAGYPVSPYGEFNFETVSLGVLAESKGELAFSQPKSTANDVEWLSYISGPSLSILSGYLANVQDSSVGNYEYIPYAPTLGDYITQEQALARYQNLQSFYDSHHHFWVGTGPYHIHMVNASTKVVDLKKFTGYNLPGDQFFSYMEPVPAEPYPDVTGGWMEEIVISTNNNPGAVVTQLANNDLDVYACGITDSFVFSVVESESDLSYYYQTVGDFYEYTFNPVGFFDDGRFNPFGFREVREALNKAIDRDHIVRDLLGGQGVPRYTCIGTSSGDAITFAPELANVTATYAYDFGAADAGIEAAMLALNATRTDGKYYYGDELVSIHLLIRTEDERLEMGDYLGDQLEALGFNVTRQYGTGSELSPIWRGSNPANGMWSGYTGAWVNTAISRDEGSNFGAFYTPLWDSMCMCETYLTPTPEFLEVATHLWNNDFTTIAERDDLFREAIPLSMEDSIRIFLVDSLAFQPLRADVVVAADAATGIYGSYMWAATIHFRNDSGVPIVPCR